MVSVGIEQQVTRSCKISNNRRGFTMVELCMGLVVLGIVMSALAAFSYAMSETWQASDTAQSLYVTGNQSVARLQNIIRSSKKIGLVRTGSLDGSSTSKACVVLWRSDAD